MKKIYVVILAFLLASCAATTENTDKQNLEAKQKETVLRFDDVIGHRWADLLPLVDYPLTIKTTGLGFERKEFVFTSAYELKKADYFEVIQVVSWLVQGSRNIRSSTGAYGKEFQFDAFSKINLGVIGKPRVYSIGLTGEKITLIEIVRIKGFSK